MTPYRYILERLLRDPALDDTYKKILEDHQTIVKAEEIANGKDDNS